VLGQIENYYLPIVRSFIFGFWIIVKSETRNTLNFLVFLYFKKRGGAKMAEVEVIKASDGVVNRRRYEGTGLKLDRKRVAAYVRVSTDDEEQLNSFQSQMEYYNEKISKNKE